VRFEQTLPQVKGWRFDSHLSDPLILPKSYFSKDVGDEARRIAMQAIRTSAFEARAMVARNGSERSAPYPLSAVKGLFEQLGHRQRAFAGMCGGLVAASLPLGLTMSWLRGVIVRVGYEKAWRPFANRLLIFNSEALPLLGQLADIMQAND